MYEVERAKGRKSEVTEDDKEAVEAVLAALRKCLVPDLEDLAVRIVHAVDAVRKEQRERVLPSQY